MLRIPRKNQVTPSRQAPLVMIVENDADTLVDLRLRLAASGYRTRYATEAEAALLSIEQQQPDLVLLGLDLPDHGSQLVLDSLRKVPRTRRAPVITLHGKTGDHSDEPSPVSTPDSVVSSHLGQLGPSAALLAAIESVLLSES